MELTITPRLAHSSGMSRTGLYRAALAGEYERIARGLYLPANTEPADWDWIEAASRRPDATICLGSALAHYDLIDDIPRALDVALPRGSRRPATKSAIRWHLFDEKTFQLGREIIPIPGTTATIGIYSAERSIADAFRLRGEMGYELGRTAMREWLRRGGQPARLARIAEELPRARGPIMRTLEALT